MQNGFKEYIGSLTAENIPWHRLLTAYGTARDYRELIPSLERADDPDEWEEIFDKMSDFESQDTLFPSAPFALIFLVRSLEHHLGNGTEKSRIIAEKLKDRLSYYLEICDDAATDDTEPLGSFADMLDDKYLLAEDIADEDLEEICEDPDSIPEELFSAIYCYSKLVLSQISEIPDGRI